MHFSLATILAVLPIFAAASPVAQVPRAKIGLAKRSNTTNSDGTVNAANLRAQLAGATNKIQRGFANYQKNTGQKHPLASSSNSKRATGKDSLTDDSAQLWYGKISVGSPAVDYTGKQNCNLNGILSNANNQLTSIPVPLTSSSRALTAVLLAPVTPSTTLARAPPPKTSASLSACNTAMARPSLASNTQIPSPSLVSL